MQSGYAKIALVKLAALQHISIQYQKKNRIKFLNVPPYFV